MTIADNIRPTGDALAGIVSRLASRPQEWMARVRLDPSERWYERLELASGYDVWLLSWLPGQRTGFHDHGGSTGAFAVASGSLEERRPGAPPHAIGAGSVRAFSVRWSTTCATCRRGRQSACTPTRRRSPA